MALAARPDDESDSDGEPLPHQVRWCWSSIENHDGGEKADAPIDPEWLAYRAEYERRERANAEAERKRERLIAERRETHERANRAQLAEYNARKRLESVLDERALREVACIRIQERERRERELIDEESRTNVELEPWLYEEARKLGLRGLRGTFQLH